MSVRAVVLGFAGVAALCGACFFNDAIIRQTVFIRNFMPISVYGGLLLFALLVNPMLGAVQRRLALRGRDVAMVFGLVLAAAYVPGYGLTQYLPVILMMPHHYARTDSAWVGRDLVESAPDFMLADTSRNEDTVLNGYVMGLSDGERHIPFSALPLYAWRRTLAFWLPLLVTFAVLSISLALIVHRQWSENERLPYPLATFADALLPDERGGLGTVYYQRLFWSGLAPVATIHLLNWASVWFPAHVISVPLRLNLQPLSVVFSLISEGGGGNLFSPLVVFTVIGFAYFLASDVSFSLGVAAPLTCLAFGVLGRYGISVHQGGYAVSANTGLYAGAYFGFLGFLAYTGRYHYCAILASAFGVRNRISAFSEGRAAPLESEVWAARVAVVAFFAMVLQMTRSGLDWQLAVLFVFSAVVLITAISRAVAETGVFYIYPVFGPATIIVGFLGYRALGPDTLLVVLLFSTVLMVNPSEALMPFVVHACRIFSLNEIQPGRAAPLVLMAIVLGLAVALPTTLYWHYDRGARRVGHDWIIHSVPRFAFNDTIRARERLEAVGLAKSSNTLKGWTRLVHVAPEPSCVSGFAVTFVLVLVTGAARMRFVRWPIHPILFLVLATWQSQILSFSFLVGWAIKFGVTRYGGALLYARMKPVMIGLIAGEVFAAVVTMVFGTLYYAITGESPRSFAVLPI